MFPLPAISGALPPENGKGVLLTAKEERETTVVLADAGQAANLLGYQDENIRLLEEALKLELRVHGNAIVISGEEAVREQAEAILQYLIALDEAGVNISPSSVQYAATIRDPEALRQAPELSQSIYQTPRGKRVYAKTLGQMQYIRAIETHDLCFAIGPAGTGKTYLAVIMAVAALRRREISRIVLVRPAVEAGEKLGFLPGDMQEKVNPYLRPLYDALYDALGMDVSHKYQERGIIEVAPMAYMRGRTLDDAFIILDEAQNTSPQQMKMFLTRLGNGSKAVVTGDITQIDLAHGQVSGLVDAEKVLAGIREIAFCYLTQVDVVRHPLVQKIIEAYERS